MSVKIYHNPRCSKSRRALELIRKKGIEPEIIEYLKDAPGESEIKTLLKKLNLKPRDIMRKGEDIYKKLKLDNEKLTDTRLIAAMAKNPILIERPIVVSKKGAVLGRPPENVKKIL